MTIDANATSMRDKVLLYVKINVQVYDLISYVKLQNVYVAYSVM